MKKIIAILMILTMIMVIVAGCGKEKEDTVTNVTEATTEQETTTQEPTTEEPMTEVEVFYESLDGVSQDDPRYQEGMKRIYKLIEGYDELIANDKNDVYKMILSCSNMGPNGEYVTFLDSYLKSNEIKTKDGIYEEITYDYNNISASYLGLVATYLYNYTNNDSGYYDSIEWVKGQESWKSILSFADYTDTTIDINSLMWASSSFLPFISINKDKFDGAILLECESNGIPNDYEISHIKPSYYIIFEFDDDIAFWCFFDENNNLLDLNYYGCLDIIYSHENIEVYPFIIDPMTNKSAAEILNELNSK